MDYDRTLEILCQRSVKWFLWIILISLIAGNLGFNVSGFIAGLSVTGFVVGFAVKDVLANLAAGMFILIKRTFVVGETEPSRVSRRRFRVKVGWKRSRNSEDHCPPPRRLMTSWIDTSTMWPFPL